MGVPKFFRWCAERYPSVITPFKDSPPPVDNLYLDMNGIIHNCTHPNDIDATRCAPTEKEMIQGMFTYLEKLFNAIQPRQYFFLAVDGVAPRAKMNQQRQRRYRAGYEMMIAREEAVAMGTEVPEEKDVFDSNCITPGTPFMVRVSTEFQYFITMKLSTDPAWQSCQVIFSGHDCPGEGEHKIVDFMRRRKMQPGYNPNETHCMYGLDADLVMLSLATHEPHFVLLREVVSFGQGRREREDQEKGLVVNKAFHKADEFVLFHLNVLRDYLHLEVTNRLKTLNCKVDFDFERVVDDFVFMCFFIGNDFLPTIPTVGINDGSMLVMLHTYVDIVLSKGAYITTDGVIDWRYAEKLLSEIGTMELETLRKRQQEEEDYQRNRARRDPGYEAPATQSMPITSIPEYKDRYYREKHGFSKGWGPTSQEMEELKLHYLEGLTWVMKYYYQGVASWKWFFPHYYAPMASDLVNLPAIAAKISFTLGTPFLPHQQLLSTLPPMSYLSIPRAYWPLLKNPSSPLARFFPEHITIDREGARAPWEGIVLIPFIDEDILIAAYESVQADVAPEEGASNCHGPAICFSHDTKMAPTTLKDALFGDLSNVRVRRVAYTLPTIDKFIPTLCAGVKIGNEQMEGFSTLQTKLKYITPSYELGQVNIFGMPTRKESMLLQLNDTSRARDLSSISSLIDTEVLVGFPHYKRARVASLSEARNTIQAVYNKDGSFSRVETRRKNQDEAMAFTKEADMHMRYMKSKLGISVESVDVLVYVHRFIGMRMTRDGRLVRQFSQSETCYPLQLLCFLDDITMVPDSRYVERDRSAIDLTSGAKCVYIGPEPKNKKSNRMLYGCTGTVVHKDPASGHYTISLRTTLNALAVPPSLRDYASSGSWFSLHQAAEKLRISQRTLSLICGSIETSPQFGSRELGLSIKFSNRNLARVGYAKVVEKNINPWYVGNGDVFAHMALDDEKVGYYIDKTATNEQTNGNTNTQRQSRPGVWYLSSTAMKLVRSYIEAFEPLVKYLEIGNADIRCLEPPSFMTGKWQQSEASDVVDEVVKFVAEANLLDIPMITATEEVYPAALLGELETSLDSASVEKKAVTMQNVAPEHLYFPLTYSSGGHLVPLPLPRQQTYRLGARVTNCSATGTTPFGETGTIVRLLSSGREAEVVYDESFTGGTRFDGRLRENRGAISKLSSLLVLRSEGESGSPASPRDAASPSSSVPASSPGAASALLERFVKKNQLGDTDKDGGSQRHTPASAHITSPGGAVNIVADSTGGGIKVSDLLQRLPGNLTPASLSSAASPPSVAAPAVLPKPRSQAAEMRGAATPASALSKDASLPYAIPDDFVTGKAAITHLDAASLFRKRAEEAVKNLLREVVMAQKK